MNKKITNIREIIETSYTISSYVEKFEAYQQQIKSSNILQTITDSMIPEFKEFIQAKFPQKDIKSEVPEAKPK